MVSTILLGSKPSINWWFQKQHIRPKYPKRRLSKTSNTFAWTRCLPSWRRRISLPVREDQCKWCSTYFSNSFLFMFVFVPQGLKILGLRNAQLPSSCPGVPQAWYSLNLAWSHHSPWPRINDLFLAIVHLDQDLARVQLLYQRGRTVLFYQEKLPIVFLDVNDLKDSLNLKIQKINSIGWEMLGIHKVLHFQRWRKSQAKSLLTGSIRQPASCWWILLSKPQGSPRYTQLSSKSASWAWCANVHCDMSSWRSQEGQWNSMKQKPTHDHIGDNNVLLVNIEGPGAGTPSIIIETCC